MIFCVSLLIHYVVKACIDAPGALLDIICRGIERRKIFTDTAEKNNFVARLGRVIVVRLFNGYIRFRVPGSAFRVSASRLKESFLKRLVGSSCPVEARRAKPKVRFKVGSATVPTSTGGHRGPPYFCLGYLTSVLSTQPSVLILLLKTIAIIISTKSHNHCFDIG